MATDSPKQRLSAGRKPAAIVVAVAVYLLSSGPVLATAFWLREATRWDGFYAAMYLYYPIFWLPRGTPLDSYIEWWVKLFGTVGPG